MAEADGTRGTDVTGAGRGQAQMRSDARPPSAMAWIAAVVDPGSWTVWDHPVSAASRDADYDAARVRAWERTGVDESVLTGRAFIDGMPVVMIVSEFGFLGGSIGVASAERIVAAFERATRDGLPVIASPASGGTRMQEGAPAFLRMVAISRAIMRHRARSLPYLVHLRHPTTGGVLASWASLGDDTSAEPGALIGLLGPRVVEAMGVEAIPEGVQRAESLLRHGLIDAVADTEGFRSRAATLLRLLAERSDRRPEASPEPLSGRGPGGSVADHLVGMLSPAVGQRGIDGGGIETWTGRLLGETVVVIAERRSVVPAVTPADLAVARRAMDVADRLGLPVVVLVDSAGAVVSRAAEEQGLAAAVGDTIMRTLQLTVPSVAVLLGRGEGAGALALCGARRVLAIERAWLAPLPMVAAAALLPGSAGDLQRIADAQRISARQLRDDGSIDELVRADRSDDAGQADLVAERIVEAVRAQRKESP